jgi:FkbM family methyltransferase
MRTLLRRGRRRLELRRLQRRMAGPKLLRAFADANPSATFVEVGANDGEQHDHLRPFILAGGWTGVMVEPVPYIFERLRRNYEHVGGVALENAAIGTQEGRLPFYYLVDASADERARLPDWYDGVGSFDKERILAHAKHMPDIESRLVCEEVPTLTFDALCRKHGIERVDVLVVDTEGYDWELLRSIDLDVWRPQLVVYEHFHLSPEDRAAALDRLRGAGYDTMEEGFDTFCLGAHADAGLRATFASLEPAVRGVSVQDEAP